MFRLCSEQTIQSSTSLWTPQHRDIQRGNNIVIITSVVRDSSSRDDYASCLKFREDVQPAGTKCGFLTESPPFTLPSGRPPLYVHRRRQSAHPKKKCFSPPRVDFCLNSRRDRAGWTDIFLPHMLSAAHQNDCQVVPPTGGCAAASCTF